MIRTACNASTRRISLDRCLVALESAPSVCLRAWWRAVVLRKSVLITSYLPSRGNAASGGLPAKGDQGNEV